MVSFFAVLFFCFITNVSRAQVANQSDWNVPPPLAPGTITKGDAEGRAGSRSTAVLRISDVTATVQPAAPYSVPELAPVSTTPPATNQPEQPASEMIAALPDTPLPEAPETPQMPDRTMQDAPEPPLAAVPMPAAPELPAPPQMPTGSANSVTTNNGLFPLMPAVSQPTQLTPPPAATILWKTPGVPESVNLN
ncbi:hypothetical protein [Mucilaginibacter auburnensis]|nr:hypothetical protein [Mucilaginibacter auburnensis]